VVEEADACSKLEDRARECPNIDGFAEMIAEEPFWRTVFWRLISRVFFCL
jgi:hypothetical protein